MLRQNNTTFTTTQIRQSLDSALDDNDQLRLQGLNNIQRAKASKLAAQKKEYRRLLLKHDRQHPRVMKLEQGIQDNTLELKSLGMEINRAATEVPETGERGWLVHGHVYNAAGDALANADVQLLLADGREIPQVTAVKSNAQGYYRITYDATSETPTGETPTEAASDAAGGDSQTPVSGMRINTNMERLNMTLQVNRVSRIVMVRASSPRDATVYADSSFIEARRGVVNYRDVIIPTGDNQDFSDLDNIRETIGQQKAREGMLRRRKKS